VGSATITSNLGQGQYVVSLTKSQAAIVAQKTSLTKRKTEIEAAIAAKEVELTELNVTLNEKYEALKSAVGNYAVADPPTKALRKAVTDAQKAYITAQSNVTKKQTEINLLGLELVSVNKRLAEIETALTVESRTAWCVDYSDALTGSVGTIEINGEADAINIMPGGAAGAGLLQHPLAMTPSGVFVNSAKLPAWQKWKPTYRAGVITSISGNTCNIALDAALSSAQSIDINQADALTNVTIKYMTSDGLLFEVGDHVVVQFVGQSQSAPRVVGFVSNPKTAGQYIFSFAGPYAPKNDPYPSVYYATDKGDGLYLYDVDTTWEFINNILYVNVLFKDQVEGHEIPPETPLYVKLNTLDQYADSAYCCKQTFANYESFVAGGALPHGKYTFHFFGIESNNTETNVNPWVRPFADLPYSASCRQTYTSYGPYAVQFSEGEFKAAGFDMYNPGGVIDWALPLSVGCDYGEVVFGGWIYRSPGGEVAVTINERITVTKWRQPLTGESGTFDEAYGWLRSALAAGKPIYLDTNGSFQVRWLNSGGTLSYTVAKSPTTYAPHEKITAYGEAAISVLKTNEYYINTYPVA